MRKQLYLSAALQLTFCWVLPAQSTILFQNTTPPSSGQPSAGSVSPTAFIGNYFVLNSPAHVDAISTAASVSDNGTMFGAIVSVASLSALPTGTPFGTVGAAAPIATAVLRPSFLNSVVSGAVSADLPAGTYVVVFGTGLYGASSGVANLPISDGSKVTLPAGANQVNYGRNCNGGTTDCWYVALPNPSPFYFAVSGFVGTGISSLNPNFATPGGPAFALTVNGSGFQPGSIINWNGATNLPTTYVNSTQLTTVVPANLVAAAGSATVTVTTNNLASSPITFVIGASSGPVITSISPTAVPPGSGGFSLTVNGSGFGTGAVVLWNGTPLITSQANNSTQLSGQVPASLLSTQGTANITVQTSGGVVSNTIVFVIGTPSAIPTVTSVLPTSANVGGATFNLTVSGINFTASSAVQWNNSLLATTFVNSSQLNASVPSNLIASAGTAVITVNNPGAGTSNSISFPIVQSTAPAISSLSPSTVAPGSATFTLTVNGSNFASGSAVSWGGSLLATTFVNSTQLTATVPFGLVAAVGTITVTVINPGNVTSNGQPFTVSAVPIPVLSSLSPMSAAPGGPNFTLTVNGSNFSPTSAISWNGQLLVTTYITATQLTANIPANLIGSAGTANVTVTTPSAGTSSPLTFTIATPTGPAITSISPSFATPGSGSFIMTVNGTGFTAASTVQWNGSPLVTTVSGPTQLQASVSSTLLVAAGPASVTVVTGSTTSNAVSFTIGAPNTPSLTTLSPSTATVGGPQLTLTVTGSNFASGATVLWNGGLLSTTFVSAAQLTAVVPASLIAAIGTANVTVMNPSGTSTTSNALTFTVTNASSASISSMSPATATAGGGQFTLTVNGQGFLSGSTVRWNGATLTTTLVSSAQLTATVPASLIAAAGTATVTVANPGGAISNSLTFTITSTSTSTTLFQTTLPPSPGQPASASLSAGQFLGNYFVLSAPAHIDSISTYAQAADGGTIFGAILSVPSLTSPPSGNPFDGTTLVTATLRPGMSSAIVTAPVSVDLPAGTYAIVFGSGGYFGSTSSSAFAAFSNGGPASVPAGWNQVSWGLYCGNGTTTCWSSNFTSPSQFYFAVTGTSTTPQGLSITNLNPPGITAGANAFTLTVNGTGFTSASTVQWNGSTLTTTFVSPTQLTAAVPAGLVQNVTMASITVLIPSTGAISNATTFTISSPVLSITSLNPPSAPAGGPAFTLTVNGSGFASGASVQWNGTPLPTTFVNPTQLTVSVPANLIATTGSASLTVLNPGGQFSNFQTFTIGTVALSISSLSPNNIPAGSPTFILTVNGAGFQNFATVLWNNSALGTTFVSSTQLTANVPSGLVAVAGTANITVQNPTGPITPTSSPFMITAGGTGSATGALAHYAVGQDFTTGLFIVNSGSTPANYAIAFYDDNGNPAALPFTSGSTTRLSGTLGAYGSVYIEAANPNGPLTQGWGQITADNGVVIQSLFRRAINNTHYEAAVASSTGSRAFELPFDATTFPPNQQILTGFAIANLDSVNPSQVTCIARDPAGNTIQNAVIVPQIRPNGHWAGASFPALNGARGTIDCTSTTNVAVIALRFIGTETLSSLPVIIKR